MRPKQETFAEAGFEKYRKPTRREEFLAQMNTVMPWEKLRALIEPAYPAGDGAGRPVLRNYSGWVPIRSIARGVDPWIRSVY